MCILYVGVTNIPIDYYKIKTLTSQLKLNGKVGTLKISVQNIYARNTRIKKILNLKNIILCPFLHFNYQDDPDCT